MTIKRRNHGRGHSYYDTEQPDVKIPGVTTIAGHLPKDALVGWAANSTIDYAIDNWAELGELPISERIRKLQRARYDNKDAAAKRGTQVHKFAARLVAGEEVVSIPDDLMPYVASYVRFLDDFDVEPVRVEQVTINREHRYCTTLDLIADLLDPEEPDEPRLRWLLELKTTRSGVYGEAVLQLAGQRYSEAMVAEDGSEEDMLAVDRTGVVWIKPTGYSFVPVDVDEPEFMDLLYVKQVMRFDDTYRELIGEPIVSPYTSNYSLVKVDD